MDIIKVKKKNIKNSPEEIEQEERRDSKTNTLNKKINNWYEPEEKNHKTN